MSTQRDLDLLVDLAKLLKKYGLETFQSLAETISSPELTQHLSSILMRVAKIAETTPKAKREKQPTQVPSIPKSLTTLKSSEPEKYQLLMKFYNDLTAKAVLPSLRDIREFAVECGLPEIRAKSRQKAISPLIDLLAKLPQEQLIAKIESVRNYAMGDRSLEGWTRIILDKQRRLG